MANSLLSVCIHLCAYVCELFFFVFNDIAILRWLQNKYKHMPVLSQTKEPLFHIIWSTGCQIRDRSCMENLETKMEETRADLAMQQRYYSFFRNVLDFE